MLDAIESLAVPIETHPDRVQWFLIKAARLIPGLPDTAIRALEVAERFLGGSAGNRDLEGARVSCWHLCNTPGGEVSSPDVAALRAAICALYPKLDDPLETVRFFFGMSQLSGGPVPEQLELLRTQLARPAA